MLHGIYSNGISIYVSFDENECIAIANMMNNNGANVSVK